MPIYEYRCKSCGFVFEDVRPASKADEGGECPNCGKARIERMMSSFSTSGSFKQGSAGGSCGSGPIR